MTANIGYQVPKPLLLEGTGNTRELGGYPGTDGHLTRKHAYLRSDGLNRLTQQDVRQLEEYGVSCVIDLRTEEEIKRQPSILFGRENMACYHVPFSDQLVSHDPEWGSARCMADLYIRLLEQQGGSYREFFRIILKHRGGTVLFNCAAGKDRTGVAAMLLLLTAGVSCKAVIADYEVSQSNMKEIFEKQWKAGTGGRKEIPLFAFMSREEDMVITMGYLFRKWGSAAGYLIANGILESEIDAFREYFLNQEAEETA